MNKYHLLILLCCISSINIFSSEKESFDKQLDRKIREDTDNWNRNNYEKNEAIRKAKEQAYRENYTEIKQLKEQHACEIALYEGKLSAMQLQLEDKDLKINQLISAQVNRKIADESNKRSEQVQRQVEERNKRIISDVLKDNQ